MKTVILTFLYYIPKASGILSLRPMTHDGYVSEMDNLSLKLHVDEDCMMTWKSLGTPDLIILLEQHTESAK